MIKLIASDYDGTLRPEGAGNMSREMKEYICCAMDRGIHFIIASGRTRYALTKRLGDLADKMDLILENGSLVISKGAILDKKWIRPEVGREIVKAVETIPNCWAMVSGVDTVYIQSNHKYLYEYVRDRVKNKITPVDDIAQDVPEQYLKLGIFCDEGAGKMEPFFQQHFGEYTTVAASRPKWVDVGPLGVDKGTALRELMDKYHVNPDQAMAFGDAANDIPLFRVVEESYAMENGSTYVKEQAKYVTSTVEEVLRERIFGS